MADAIAMSMGGRVANIYKQNTKRRRFTTVVNEIENKRLDFLKKQLEADRVIEYNKLSRLNSKAMNSNDELKAFQVALLRRITSVKEQSSFEPRSLGNLGKYGGATVEQIKAESLKYKKIRDPEKRRRIKSKILMEQGKRDGRIKNFNPDDLGDQTENILKLTKAEMTRRPQFDYNVPRLDNVIEADEFSKDFSENITESTRATYPPSAHRRLVLPPLQVSRSLKPNENYYRKISVEHYKRGGGKTLSPIHQRMAVLADITGHHETDKHNNIKPQSSIGSPRQISPSLRPIGFPITSIKQYSNDYKPSGESGADKYEWNYSKTVGPVKMSKHLNDSQKFWKPRESLKAQKSSRRVVLPKIG